MQERAAGPPFVDVDAELGGGGRPAGQGVGLVGRGRRPDAAPVGGASRQGALRASAAATGLRAWAGVRSQDDDLPRAAAAGNTHGQA